MSRTSRDRFLHAKSVTLPSHSTHKALTDPLTHSYHIVLSREYCTAPENRATVERLVHGSDETCAWAAVLDVHVFADSTFDWSAPPLLHPPPPQLVRKANTASP